MSVIIVTKKEVQDAIRSRALLGLTCLFVFLAAGFTFLLHAMPSLVTTFGGSKNVHEPFTRLAIALNGAIYYLVPLTGLVLGYKSVSGERESGSIKFVMGLPHTRRDLVLGKTVGRTVVVCVSLAVGFLVTAVLVAAFYESFSFVDYLSFLLVTLLLAAAFVSIGVGFSAGVRSTGRALYSAIGLFLLFYVWPLIPTVVRYVLNGSAPQTKSKPTWATLFLSLNPEAAYQNAVATVIPELKQFATSTTGPFYLRPWFGFVILAVWASIPLLLGYVRFRRMDF